jgi:hypothetical protein
VLRNQDTGGNTAVLITASGVVVVDRKYPEWGQPIVDKIRELTDNPVTTIVNTHTHPDHLSGSVEFAPTVDIVVHENTAANINQRMQTPGAKPTVFEANKGRGVPKRTFQSTLMPGIPIRRHLSFPLRPGRPSSVRCKSLSRKVMVTCSLIAALAWFLQWRQERRPWYAASVCSRGRCGC